MPMPIATLHGVVFRYYWFGSENRVGQRARLARVGFGNGADKGRLR